MTRSQVLFLAAVVGFSGLVWLHLAQPVRRARRRHHRVTARDVESYLSDL